MLYQIIVIDPTGPCDLLISVEHTPEAAQHVKSVIESRCKVPVRIHEMSENINAGLEPSL